MGVRLQVQDEETPKTPNRIFSARLDEASVFGLEILELL